MTDLQALIDKLEKAEAGSASLDLALSKAAEPYGMHLAAMVLASKPTTSLDAAIALVERVLPGVGWEVITGSRCPGEACFWARVFADGKVSNKTQSHALTPSLALCTALLKALHAKEQAR